MGPVAQRVDSGSVHLVMFKNGQKYTTSPIELDRESDPDAVADELHVAIRDSIQFYFSDQKEEKS